MKTGTSPTVSVRPALFTRADAPTDAEAILAYAKLVEDYGFDGIFVGDRMLAEAAAGGKTVYSASAIEPTTIMAAIAARTERLKVGLLIYVIPYRRPLQIAKTFASLDVIANGRIIMGAGLGWNPKEFEALGLDMSDRGSQFEEAIPLIRRLWKGESVSVAGKWSQLDQIMIAPRAIQAEGPPIWMASFAPSHNLDFSGGFSRPIDTALRRVGRLADGWAPLTYSASAKRRITAEHLADAWAIVAEGAAAAGRSTDAIDIVQSDWVYVLEGPGAEERCYEALSIFFTGTWEEARNTYVIGTADEVVQKLRSQTSLLARDVGHYLLTPLSSETRQLDLLRDEVAPALRRGRASG